MKYWCLLDWGGTDIRALRRASHGSDIDYNIQLRSMAFDNDMNYMVFENVKMIQNGNVKKI